MKLTGKVSKGRIEWDSLAAYAIACREHEGRRIEVEIEAEQSRRSPQANNRYWGFMVPLAGDLLSKTRDVPLSKEQVHFVLVSAFAGCDETPLGLVPVATRTMDKKQFQTFTENVEKWLNENGYYLPAFGEEVSA